jgi:thioredoxin-dependent peroxiredoxin
MKTLISILFAAMDSSSMKLKPGDVAPDFELTSGDGNKISLGSFKGSKNVVLYFYPKDFTAGCTAETKTFGESYDDLSKLGAEVLGVSSDSVESHKNFGKECGASFPLLADEGGRVRKLYGVEKSLGFIPGRVTYVIDKDGVIRGIFSSQTNVRGHAAEAMKILNSLQRVESQA